MARRILELAGDTVLVADGGQEALRLLERRGGEVDLVFTDVMMPGMSGGDLGREVRERYPEMKILHTSGYARDATARDAAINAEVCLIPKPYSTETLSRKAVEVLGT